MSSLLVFDRFCRLEIQPVVSQVGIFVPSCEILPLYLSHWFPSPFPCVNMYRSTVRIYTVCNGGGGEGGIGLCVQHILLYMSCTLCIWPDSEPTKLLYHPRQKKNRRGGSLRHINTCRQIPLLVNFKKIQHLGLEYISYFVHEVNVNINL